MSVTATMSVRPAEGPERQRVAEIDDFLRRHHRRLGDGPTRLVSADGEEVPVPVQLFDLLREIAATLARGDGVAVNAISRELSTTEAAKLLGMSRPSLVRLLDDATIPAHRVGSHRRVFLRDVLDFRQRQLEERRRSYEALMRESDALGLDDE
ncbi:excisionase family DNA-binding protein [Micromonospora carbonacea]|uniref:excisionase family DNA-binding protein n=1 Tax=Micromonospora carbonacea TaxID=47853 RepID=UPI00340C7C46